MPSIPAHSTEPLDGDVSVEPPASYLDLVATGDDLDPARFLAFHSDAGASLRVERGLRRAERGEASVDVVVDGYFVVSVYGHRPTPARSHDFGDAIDSGSPTSFPSGVEFAVTKGTAPMLT